MTHEVGEEYVVNDNMQKGISQRKRKHRTSTGNSATIAAETMLMQNTNEVSKKRKEKNKRKSKHEVGFDIILDGANVEALNTTVSVEVDDDCREDDRKKKKDRKLKHEVGKDFTDSDDTQREKRRSLQTFDVTCTYEADDLHAGKSGNKKSKSNGVEVEKSTVSLATDVYKDEGNVHKSTLHNDVSGKKNENDKHFGEDIEQRKRKKDSIFKWQTPAIILDVERRDIDEQAKEFTEDKVVGKTKKFMKDEVVGKAKEFTEDKFVGKQAKLKKSKRENRRLIAESNAKRAQGSDSKIIRSTSNNYKCEGNLKKVRFSPHIEVFPFDDDVSREEEQTQPPGLVWGKRFSLEEDKMLRDAVYEYIETHDLGDEGLDKVMHCLKYPEVKGCWKEIAAALPHRPYQACYLQAHKLFEGDGKRKWTKEEYGLLRKHHDEKGNDWKLFADEVGRSQFHVKSTWYRIKIEGRRNGRWTQDEYQTLFDLVNKDLTLKIHKEKISKRDMLRDNIAWTATSDTLATRSYGQCCAKWYSQLTSPMVAEGLWDHSDDYRLLDALFNLDASCVENVDWDYLIEGRPGDVCRKRWEQMTRHIGHYGLKSFPELVETLAKRYCPELIEVRETSDSKPFMD